MRDIKGKIKEGIISAPSRLEIYSLHGKRYLNRTVSGGTQLEIPADGYPEGMYILRLSGMSGEKTVKWIKVR